jgi:hypothetical protein
MGEDQQDNLTYHFSKKILILSLLFLAVNIALYGLFLYQKNSEMFHEVAPVFVFSGKQDIKIKTPFDSDFASAKSGQALIAGSRVTTGDASYAEIQLDKNVLRLDQNTDIQLTESNFQQNGAPRLVFQLYAGGVWVNAFDPIIITTEQSQARFAHTVGLYTYAKPLNRIFSVLGDIDLTLFGENGDSLAKFIIPLKNQATYVNSQLIPDYAKLQYTKLKKELKISPISQSILDDEWIKNNTEDEMARLQSQSDYIFSSAEYDFDSQYYSFRAMFSLIPEKKQLEKLNLAATKLKYLLGGIDAANDNDQAKIILGEFDALAGELSGDPLFEDLVQNQFYIIRNVRTDTPAYLVKEDLRNYLLTKYKDPELLRTYLEDIDFLLRVGEVSQAEKVADIWLKQWKPGFKKDHSDEFDQQSRIYHSTLLAYIGKITFKFLDILDQTGDYRIQNAKSPDDVLFEVATERLDISKYLVAAYRYSDAKTYLKTSYSNLKLSESTTSVAARDLFIQDAALLADRIAFAETSLKGSATSIDEAQFRDYLATQERDKSLAERFTNFLQENQAAATDQPVYPTVSDVSHEFATNGIVVLEEDIAKDSDPDNHFEFDIKKAVFTDRASDGSLITFTARFNYPNKAVYNVVLNGKALKGNFTIGDFVRVVQSGGQDIKTPNTPSGETIKLTDFTNLQDSQDAQRSQIIAQDLAAQLVIKELEQYNILIPSTQQVVVTNPATLTEFQVTDVYIQQGADQREQLQISFDYNSLTKIASNITLLDGLAVTFPDEVAIDQLISVVTGIVSSKEKEFEEAKNVTSELDNLGLVLQGADLSFIGTDFNQISFNSIRFKAMPIEFKGQYDRQSKTFISASNPLLTSNNISVSDYMAQLAELWTIDYLGKQGIHITSDNIATPLPADKVDITKYARGSKVLNFTYDVNSNNLTDISLEGVSTVVPSMTFEEFGLIQGAETVTPPKPTTPAVSDSSNQTTDLIGTCADFPDRLTDCVKYSCSFPHPVTKETMIRRITGLNGDKCRYVEQMPDSQYMECNYSTGFRSAVAQEYKDLLTLGKVLVSGVSADVSKFSYTVDGNNVADPAQEAITNGECVVGKQ